MSETIATSTTRETRQFVYGLERISQTRTYQANNQNQTQTSYYVYDGHGSVRALTDPNGNVTDTYDYDAFGNLIHSTSPGIPPGSTNPAPTPNEFLFAGEQFDSDLHLYYNRGRYLNVTTDRFWTMDTFEGDLDSSLSLHKYLYASDEPTDRIDPSGNQDDIEVAEDEAIDIELDTQTGIQNPAQLKTPAQAVVAVSQIQTALTTLLLISTVAAVSLTLVGDEGNYHRGRLQVQGTDIAEEGTRSLIGHEDFKLNKDTLSWPWNLNAPLPAATALTKLSEFLQILTFDESGRRETAFAAASRFIVNAKLGGGAVAPVSKTFNARDPFYPDARVDIEVQAGRAFVPVQ